MLIADIHSHSCVSPDGSDTAEEMVRCAKLNGVDILCITDHYEVAEKERPDYKDIEPNYDKTMRVRGDNDGVKTLVGIEMGGAIYEPQQARDVLSRHDFDFVLNSLHHVFYGKEAVDYYGMDYTGCNTAELLRDYFKTLYEQCKLNLFDSLAHIDYPTRYMRQRNVPFDLSDCDDEIDAVLKYLCENGKALEINTSGLFASYHTTLPQADIIRRYRSFGGEFVTLGSDSHEARFLGRGIKEGIKEAAEAGIKYIAYYEKRQLRTISID